MDQVLQKQKPPQLMQHEIDHSNSAITIKKKIHIFKIPKIKSPGPNGFIREFYQIFNKLTLFYAIY